LIDDGKDDQVHDIRRSFQATMKQQFTELVEESTGRKVIAYMSQIHTNPDLAVELFILAPGDESVVGEHGEDIEPDEAAA
jgi:uncharacterized protein YbcI